MFKRVGVICGLCLVFLLAACFSTATAQTYTITDLGDLGGGTGSYAFAINNNGQIVGEASAPNTTWEAFLWNDGKMINLNTINTFGSVAYGINASDQVVGVYWTSNTSNIYQGFLYSNGQMTSLGILCGAKSMTQAINDAGEIVGVNNSNGHPFLWSNGQVTDISNVTDPSGTPYGINNSGQITGFYSPPTGNSHAFLYTPGSGFKDLGVLGNANSGAYAVNNLGEVVGYSDLLQGNDYIWVHAFLYSDGVMHDLGTLGGSQSHADGINDLGQVVGNSYTTGDAALHAVLWDPGTMMIHDLNDLIPSGSGWTLTTASGINNNGWICGYGMRNGIEHGFLLAPLQPPTITSFSINNGAASTTSQTVTLNNTATENPTFYMASEDSNFTGASWISYSSSPQFTLSSGGGTKTVYFKVINPAGTSAATSASIVLQVLTAGFTAVPTSGKAPLKVSFVDQSIGGTVKTWLWDFGDGKTSKIKPGKSGISHTYAKAGTYTVSLTVTGTDGRTNTFTRPNYVFAYALPKANFVAKPVSGKAPLAVSFTNKSTGTITGYQWDFGDGGTSTDQNPPPHVYTAAGKYTAKLTASGPGGGSSVKTAKITVTAPKLK